MTNEELAIMAAQGDRESLHKLYFAVVPLLYKLISRYFPLCRDKLAEPEDLLQCGYFAVLEAIKGFSPESGFLFNSYLSFPVQNICRRELGFIGRKQVETISLETPIDDEESLTLEDAIEDPDADTYNYCELNIMRLIVREEIDKLPPREQCVIYGVFFENKTTQELAQELGWDTRFVKSVKFAAYNMLQSSEAMQALKKAYQFHDNLTPECMIVSFGDSGLEIL
ncbi:RNA polymerase sigma factor [Syntrophomonas wolfei]|uniref:RNA polymerase sigma factor n=1 Tax=Syntrophomonas wolfei TaxID=863 RepID=UPI0023F23FFE|nr:sigma-70 family RNA polymerase sigma factor [Syntrophomonas wolfei]